MPASVRRLDQNAAIPDQIVFECSACGALHNTVALPGSATIPVGWSQHPRSGAVWCGSCTALGIPQRELAGRASRLSTSRAANQ